MAEKTKNDINRLLKHILEEKLPGHILRFILLLPNYTLKELSKIY